MLMTPGKDYNPVSVVVRVFVDVTVDSIDPHAYEPREYAVSVASERAKEIGEVVDTFAHTMQEDNQ